MAMDYGATDLYSQMGMTPYEYGLWAKSRETAGDYVYTYRNGEGTGSGYHGLNTGGGGGSGQPTPGLNPAPATPPKVPIATPADAIALAQQQRVRDATNYRYGLAGMPTPIDIFSPDVATSMSAQPAAGIRYSTQPGTGAYPSQTAVEAYVKSLEPGANNDSGTGSGTGSGTRNTTGSNRNNSTSSDGYKVTTYSRTRDW